MFIRRKKAINLFSTFVSLSLSFSLFPFLFSCLFLIAIFQKLQYESLGEKCGRLFDAALNNQRA